MFEDLVLFGSRDKHGLSILALVKEYGDMMFTAGRHTKPESATEWLDKASTLKNQIDAHINNLESQPEISTKLFQAYHPYFKRWTENGEPKASLHFGKKSYDLTTLEMFWLQTTITKLQNADQEP